MNLRTKNIRVLFMVLSLIAAMTALVSASYPLYQLFCKVTGYGGTTQQVNTSEFKVGDREFTIRFNSDISPSLPWDFFPQQKTMDIKVGENAMAFYTSKNLSDQPITGMATYNVTPNKAGIYFHKIQCFCFDEQTLEANQKVDMPISYYIDPAIMDDPYLDDVSTITLSYTFFKSKKR